MMRHPGTGRLMWPKRLPFGYVESPRLFCAMTESIAQRFRERMAGKGVQVWCFVDDYLVAGDTQEITEWACGEFKALLEEFGLCWAPHKHRGCVQCIEFLGLLISNVDGHRRIGLSRKRTLKLRGMIDDWTGRRPANGAPLAVDPREVAKLLGHLVFASGVVPNGRAYMQAMLSSFAGLRVDWQRGVVSTAGKSCGLMHLGTSFWEDLRWWSAHLEMRNSTPIGEPPRAEAAVAGTDASNWGCGELLWLNGQRAEVMLRFTEAEVRRPINWRELLGIVRVVEVWGHELRGKRLLIETDNMAAKCSAAKGSSKAEDMQELVRRLVETCERWEIDLKLMHTPGVMLHRPDATSRGDPVEEPRQRLRRAAFEKLWASHGPFGEMVGAERDHVPALGTHRQCQVTLHQGRHASLWMHPTHATVGSALRLIGERMAQMEDAMQTLAGPVDTLSGLMLVPRAPEAAWWPMLKYFDVVGVLEAGGGHLEANRLGSWAPLPARRDTLVLRFPRVAGARARRVGVRGGDSPGPDYVRAGEWWVLMVHAGAIVFAPEDGALGGGDLLRVESDLSAESFVEGGDGLVACGLLLRSVSRVQAAHRADQGVIFEYDPTCAQTYQREGATYSAWGYDPDALWEVPDACRMVAAITPSERAVQERGGCFYAFDQEAATQGIEPVGTGGAPLETRAAEWLAGVEELTKDTSGEDDRPVERTAQQLDGEQEALVAVGGGRKPEAAPETLPAQRGAQLTPNRYIGVRCLGCGERFVRMSPMHRWREGFIHPKCQSLAEATRSGEQPAGTVAQVAQTGSSLRKVQLEEKYSEARLGQVACCLSGKCSGTGAKEVVCQKGCGRGLHTMCAQISHGHAKLANLTCLECRIAAVGLSRVPQERQRTMMVTMLMELTTGKASTAYGYGEYSRLETDFVSGYGAVAGRGGQGGSLLLPRHSAAAFKDMLTWLVLDSQRALSLESFARTAGAFFTITKLVDWTKTAEIKAHIKNLKELHGLESMPATHGTRRMLSLMITRIIPGLNTSGLIKARSILFLVMEAVGGLRVGEAMGGGDHHGMLANNVCILRDTRDGSVSVEGRLEHTKTKHVRWINMVGTTETEKIKVAGALADYWKLAGMEAITRREGYYTETRPDYWVVRFSLLGASEGMLAELESILSSSKISSVRKLAGNSMYYARMRSKLKHDVEDKSYVNVAGGRRDSVEIQQTVKELHRAGFGSRVRVTLGPLIRATSGSSLTHMPLSPDSTYKLIHSVMDDAYRMANSQELGPDPELDLMGALEPHWTHHSWRRFADKVARDTRKETGVSDTDIDLFFGWLEAFYRKLMQLHYAGRTDRVKRSRVTMMI